MTSSAMILECPKCHARFEIGAGVEVAGRKVRCSRCAHVWQVQTADAGASPAPPATTPPTAPPPTTGGVQGVTQQQPVPPPPQPHTPAPTPGSATVASTAPPVRPPAPTQRPPQPQQRAGEPATPQAQNRTTPPVPVVPPSEAASVKNALVAAPATPVERPQPVDTGQAPAPAIPPQAPRPANVPEAHYPAKTEHRENGALATGAPSTSAPEIASAVDPAEDGKRSETASAPDTSESDTTAPTKPHVGRSEREDAPAALEAAPAARAAHVEPDASDVRERHARVEDTPQEPDDNASKATPNGNTAAAEKSEDVEAKQDAPLVAAERPDAAQEPKSQRHAASNADAQEPEEAGQAEASAAEVESEEAALPPESPKAREPSPEPAPEHIESQPSSDGRALPDAAPSSRPLETQALPIGELSEAPPSPPGASNLAPRDASPKVSSPADELASSTPQRVEDAGMTVDPNLEAALGDMFSTPADSSGRREPTLTAAVSNLSDNVAPRPPFEPELPTAPSLETNVPQPPSSVPHRPPSTPVDPTFASPDQIAPDPALERSHIDTRTDAPFATDFTNDFPPTVPGERRGQHIHPDLHRRRAALNLGWFCLAAIIGSIIGIVTLARESVVRTLPGAASFYSAIGTPVNIRGLDFADVTYKWVTRDGRPSLAVKGKIRNISNVPLEVPTVVFVLLDDRGDELYNWASRVREAPIATGDVVSFEADVPAPPGAARRLQVRFARKSR